MAARRWAAGVVILAALAIVPAALGQGITAEQLLDNCGWKPGDYIGAGKNQTFYCMGFLEGFLGQMRVVGRADYSAETVVCRVRPTAASTGYDPVFYDAISAAEALRAFIGQRPELMRMPAALAMLWAFAESSRFPCSYVR